MRLKSCTIGADLAERTLELRSRRAQSGPDEEEATMLRLFKLPGAMVELAVGTVIVHLGLAGARSGRTLPGNRVNG